MTQGLLSGPSVRCYFLTFLFPPSLFQVAMRSASKFGAAPTPAAAAARSRKNRWDAATAKPTTTPAVTVSATGANALADASTAAAKLVAEAAAASGVAVPPGEGTLGKRSRGFSEGGVYLSCVCGRACWRDC